MGEGLEVMPFGCFGGLGNYAAYTPNLLPYNYTMPFSCR